MNRTCSLDFNRHIKNIHIVLNRWSIRFLEGSSMTPAVKEGVVARNIMIKFSRAYKKLSYENLVQEDDESIKILQQIQPLLLGALHGEMADIALKIRNLKVLLVSSHHSIEQYQTKASCASKKSSKQAARAAIYMKKIQMQKTKLELQNSSRHYRILSKEVDWLESFTFLKPPSINSFIEALISDE